MGRLNDFDPLARNGVTVASNHKTGQWSVPVLLHGFGHRGRGLAGPDHKMGEYATLLQGSHG